MLDEDRWRPSVSDRQHAHVAVATAGRRPGGCLGCFGQICMFQCLSYYLEYVCSVSVDTPVPVLLSCRLTLWPLCRSWTRPPPGPETCRPTSLPCTTGQTSTGRMMRYVPALSPGRAEAYAERPGYRRRRRWGFSVVRETDVKGTNPPLKSCRMYPKYKPKCSVCSTDYVCNFLPKNI